MPRRLPLLKAVGPARTARPAPRHARPDAAAARAPGSTQRIIDAITTAISERRLMPGTKLSEQKIGDIFKVSRTVVRQAFNQLCRDRLLVLEPARGAFVATPSVDEACDVFEVRDILEAAITRRLCQVITDEQLKALRAHLETERAAVAGADVSGRTRLLADFHLLLAQMLGNQVLVQVLGELLTRSSLIALMYQSSHSAEASLSEHVAIVAAFEQRDAELALRLTSAHLDNVRRNLQLDPDGLDLARILKATA